MTEIAAPALRHPRRYVRLDTILRLRWLAVLGQLAAIFIVVQGLEFDVPVIPCVAIIGLSALLNLVLQTAFNPLPRLEPPPPPLGGAIALRAGLLPFAAAVGGRGAPGAAANLPVRGLALDPGGDWRH